MCVASASRAWAASIAKSETPLDVGLDRGVARGDLSLLPGWLRRNVHGVGSHLPFNELLQAATEKPLHAADFQAHLTARYLA